MPNLEQLDLRTDKIVDESVRDSMQGVEVYLQAQALLQGEWKFFEINFTGEQTNLKYAHDFNFTPTDVLITSIQGDHRVVFNYELFDGTNLDITTEGPVKVRFFAGRYEDSRGNLIVDPHDTVSSTVFSQDLDGGRADSVYLPVQLADGGGA